MISAPGSELSRWARASTLSTAVLIRIPSAVLSRTSRGKGSSEKLIFSPPLPFHPSTPKTKPCPIPTLYIIPPFTLTACPELNSLSRLRVWSVPTHHLEPLRQLSLLSKLVLRKTLSPKSHLQKSAWRSTNTALQTQTYLLKVPSTK